MAVETYSCLVIFQPRETQSLFYSAVHHVPLKPRVAHLEIFEKLVFVITYKISRIPTEDLERKDSSDYKLPIESISSIRILSILEVITKTIFSKIEKCVTLPKPKKKKKSGMHPSGRQSFTIERF